MAVLQFYIVTNRISDFCDLVSQIMTKCTNAAEDEFDSQAFEGLFIYTNYLMKYLAELGRTEMVQYLRETCRLNEGFKKADYTDIALSRGHSKLAVYLSALPAIPPRRDQHQADSHGHHRLARYLSLSSPFNRRRRSVKKEGSDASNEEPRYLPANL